MTYNDPEGKLRHYSEYEIHQLYNGLDTAVTLEVFEALSRQHNHFPEVYSFAKSLQAPVLEMMLRGWRIDIPARDFAAAELRSKLSLLKEILDEFAKAVWDKGLNARSPKQLQEFFYDTMCLPKQWVSKKGERKLSLDRDTLEKLSDQFHAKPIINVILAIRDLEKQLSVIETEIDPDNRFRASFNIAGTETARFSSSGNAFGTGSNIQNIAPILRYIFTADPGYKIIGIDLEQAESREVGWLCGTLFNDWTYLDAAYSGDLHTLTCKLIWKDLPWTGDKKLDRAIADENFYRDYSYRDMSKRGGHGCLTEDHEVLTRKGWVKISTKPEEILTWSPTKTEFASASNWIDKDYSGGFVRFEGTSVSLLATEDHRIIYYKDKRDSVHAMPAKNILQNGFMPLGDSFIGGNEFISPEEARLIAAFQCDGNQKSTNYIHFHLKKERKIARLQELCDAANINLIRNNHDDYAIQAASWPKDAGAYLLTWPKKSLQAYIEEHKYWDGHVSSTAVSLFSTKKGHLEWLQTIGRILGIGGNIQKPKTSGYGSIVYNLQQNNRKYATLRCLTRAITKETHRVYCPTVPSGAFYVRRNGKICVTGNSNYFGTPRTMAMHLKVPVKLMEDFQKAYFTAFAGIAKWHKHVAQELQTTKKITTPWGRTRTFFGRPGDDTTLREAIAYSPQSSTADRMNLGLYRLWEYFGSEIQLLAQVHDAVYFQIHESSDEAAIISKALSLIDIPMFHGDRKLIVPGEAKSGWNWGNYCCGNRAEGRCLTSGSPCALRPNPNGMKKFKSADLRTRIL